MLSWGLDIEDLFNLTEESKEIMDYYLRHCELYY